MPTRAPPTSRRQSARRVFDRLTCSPPFAMNLQCQVCIYPAAGNYAKTLSAALYRSNSYHAAVCSDDRHMKVLLVHNKYRTSAPSGEDIAVANERRMLENRGI